MKKSIHLQTNLYFKMDTKKELANFYDKEATKYYQTRNKHRSDWDIIIQEIQKYWKQEISILEFWCWWWRCISHLNKNLKWIKINYTWVDLSKNLLTFAKKDNPMNKFVCEDITNFIKRTKQESFDFIIWIASFQHIPTKNERLFLMKSFYQSLKYWWKLIMTNRSFSKRFLKKYKRTIVKSIFKSIYTLGWHSRNNIEIPRKNWNNIDYRFYHIFLKEELKSLWKESSFILEKLTYIDKYWHTKNTRVNSSNSLFIAKKEIFL